MAYGQTAPKEYPSVKRKKAAVLWFLAHHGGIHESKSGRAASELADAIRPALPGTRPTTLSAFTNLLTQLENDQLVIRDVNGRRTMSIALVPDAAELVRHPRYGADPWPGVNGSNGTAPAEVEAPPADDTPAPGPAPAPDPEPAPAPVAVQGERWTAPAPLPPDADPHQLLGQALSYIAQAIATSRPIDRTDPDVLARLATTLEDNQRLRQRARAAEDHNHALRDEVSGLRKAKALLEDNVRTIAAGRLDESALRRFRELERFMQAKPNAKA